MREVEFYHRDGERLICDICPHHCQMGEGEVGICRGRQRIGERLIAVNYAQVASAAVDPIEKKPLYHFRPGSEILSIGVNGCNLQCQFCQNCELSQGEVPSQLIPIAELIKLAGMHGSIGVAFTYSEPLIWYEYVLDAARELRQNGLVSVLVTNGFVEEEPLRKLLPYVDALNVDLKSPLNEFYRELCKAQVEPVKRTIQMAHTAGAHVEITHLVVTGWNDNEASIHELVRWIASVDDAIPLHLSRYFPRHQYHEPATSGEFLNQALPIARRELKFVYLGNTGGDLGTDTRCPDCMELLVTRSSYRVKVVGLKGTSCGKCGRKIPILMRR